MSKFDELFNDFMNDGRNNNNKDESADIMANLFKKLSNLNNFDKNGMMEELNESLGEPDTFKNYEENGVFFQKQIWNTKHGQVIKTIVSDVPFAKEKNEVKKTRTPLEVQLLNAVKEENYELAAKLRDRIAKRNANKTKK
jgi:protein-arginine kinase activator protein McsA